MTTRSRAARARQIAVKAAYGTGAVGLLGITAAALLVGQALRARQVIPVATDAPLPCDGRYGDNEPGKPLTLALIGDSTAAGFGVESPEETPGALMGMSLSQALHRPVDVRCPAVVGALSKDLPAQLDLVLANPPDIVAILVGANDVTRGIRPLNAVRHLDRAVRRLIEHNVRVVVGTCPDLGAIQPIRRPLRWIAREWSRELAAAQTVAVVAAGGRTVSLGDLLGAEFLARPEEMFAHDQFHPSALGYARAVAVVLPSLITALGYDENLARTPAIDITLPPAPAPDGVQRLAHAAVAAANNAGTEVAPVSALDAANHVSDQHGRRLPPLLGELRHRLHLLAELLPGKTREHNHERPRDPAHVRDTGTLG